MTPTVVIDTNVLVAALRSRQGASFQLLSRLGTEEYRPAVSVPLVLEYEYAANKCRNAIGLTEEDVAAVIDYLCAVAMHVEVHFLWRPLLRDAQDDMVLEVAVAAGCKHIITFNVRDFAGAERFGIRAVTPQAFLTEIGSP